MGRVPSIGGLRLNIIVMLVTGGVAALVCFAAAEAWIRLTRPYATPDTERAAALEYEVSAFSRHVFPQEQQIVHDGKGGVLATISPQGYRGASFTLPKPEDTVRIVVVGGSAAFDLLAKDGRDWPHLVERRLRRHGYPNVEVINAGTPGHATWDALGRLYGEIWTINPDYVVVYECWNDVKYFPWLTPSHSLLRGVRPPRTAPGGDGVRVDNPFIHYSGPIDHFFCHSQLYVRLRTRYWRWRLGQIGLEGLLARPNQEETPVRDGFPDTYSPLGVAQYELNLRLIAAAARAIGATPVFFTQARLVNRANTAEDRAQIAYEYVKLSHEGLVRGFEDCDRAMQRVAEDEKVPLVDVAGAVPPSRDLFADHVHTKAPGSKRIARVAAESLDHVLAERRGVVSPAAARRTGAS